MKQFVYTNLDLLFIEVSRAESTGFGSLARSVEAFAKFLGGYQHLDGRSTAWALSVMTGDPARRGDGVGIARFVGDGWGWEEGGGRGRGGAFWQAREGIVG